MGDAERLADTVLLVMRTELAPMRERMIGLVERNAALQTEVITLRADVGQLRERVAVAEARPGPPGPAGADGKDGAAGVTADALTVTQDGEDERVLTFGVKAGDTVTVDGYLARDGSHLANARVVTLSDGRKMSGGTAADAPGN